MHIVVTGLHSGTNPGPGVGIARSLRAAFPDVRLIGADYSPRSSGLHWPGFSAVEVHRPWSEMHLPTHAAHVRKHLNEGGCWLSGTDLESRWLAEVFAEDGKHSAGLLSPPLAVFDAIAKPAVRAASEALPVRIAPFVEVGSLSDWELHAFCRQHDWNLWLKGPYYDALRVGSWSALESSRLFLGGVWSTDELYLQAHVQGVEESVCFCAYRGELLEAVHMRKRDVTEIGKTWAGQVSEVPADFLKALRGVVSDLHYTGGGELEMVRDAAGELWMLEWNPRFPAWIYGSTLAGINLPATLVSRATGMDAEPTPVKTVAGEFTRMVTEVPVRAGYPLPPLPEALPGIGLALKHPSGLPGLAKSLHKSALDLGKTTDADTPKVHAAPPPVPQIYLEDAAALNGHLASTPASVFMRRAAADGFTRTARAVRKLSTESLTLRPGYSIKTNPDERLIHLAREAGFFAEAITLPEVRKAIACGFAPADIILNGPGKWHPDGVFPTEPLAAVFCDSIADLRRVAEGLQTGAVQTHTVGVRLRPPQMPSRFGISVDSPQRWNALADAVDALPQTVQLGVHVHMASSHFGVERWWQLFRATLGWCRSLEDLTGRPIQTLDLGGGWASDDWFTALEEGPMARATTEIVERLPSVRRLVVEPGKALAAPAAAVGMRILEIKDGAREVVVDGSIAELPMAGFQPHRILHRPAAGGAWRPLGRGAAQLQGRLCMEHDFVATSVALPHNAAPGDLLLFCDAGAYDKSMAYDFGRG